MTTSPTPIQQYADDLHMAAEAIAQHVGHRASTLPRDDGGLDFRCHGCSQTVRIPAPFHPATFKDQRLYVVVREEVAKFIGQETGRAMAHWGKHDQADHADTVARAVVDAILSEHLGPS